MLIRLLLTLMLAMAGIPAAAMPCHDAAPVEAPMAGHSMTHSMPLPDHAPSRDAAPTGHFCVGCIPPVALLGARVEAPPAMPAAAPVARTLRLDPGRGDPPSLPPPRDA